MGYTWVDKLTPRKSLMSAKGFSIVETIVIMGIIAVVTAVGISIYSVERNSRFSSESGRLLADLRQSQSSARTVDNNKEYGISFTGTSYTSFSRDPASGTQTNIATTELKYATLSAAIAPDASQIVFSRLSGLPQNNTEATLTLTMNGSSRQKVIRVETTGVMYVQ